MLSSILLGLFSLSPTAMQYSTVFLRGGGTLKINSPAAFWRLPPFLGDL